MSQQKTQLQQVTEFLLASLTPFVKANNIDAWQEGGSLILNGQDLGLSSYQVAKWRHNAVIIIESFPHHQVAPYNLLAMLAAFLLDSNWPRDDYGLSDPQLDIDVISKDNATVIIEIELIDDINLVPNEQGPVLFGGARYSVDTVAVSYAETINVEVQAGEA